MTKLNLLILCLGISNVLISRPLSLNPQNPHLFMYEGEAILLIGSGEHYGAVMNLEFDYKKYLATFNRDGQNITRLFTGAHREPVGAFDIERNTMAPSDDHYICAWAKTASGKYDLSHWNEDYFQRLTSFVKLAEKNGIIVEITLFSSIYTNAIWDLSPLNPENNIQSLPDIPYQQLHTVENEGFRKYLEAYTRKVVKTLNPYDNIYFEIQNEPWSDNAIDAGTWNEFIQAGMLKSEHNMWRCRVDLANERSLEWQKKIAKIIRDTEQKLPKKHLISQNYSNFQYPVAVMDPNIDILTFHYAFPSVVAQNYHWNKPVCINETGFCGRESEPYRLQAWRFMLSGGGMYNNLDYSFTVGQEDGTDTTNLAPGHGSPAFRNQLLILRNFLEDFELVSLKPDDESILAAYGAITYCLSDGKNQWAIFGESYKGMVLEIQLPKGEYKVSWMDVRSGKNAGEEIIETERQPVKISPESRFPEMAVKIVRL